MSPILSTILSATWEKKKNKFTGYNPISLGILHNYEPHDKLLLMTYTNLKIFKGIFTIPVNFHSQDPISNFPL